MLEFLYAALSFPTAIFTALLGIVLIFWTGVLMAGLDLESLDFGGDADVSVDGADIHADVADVHADAADVHAVHAGAADADTGDLHADGDHADGDHAGSHHVEGHSWLSGLLGFMNVGTVPVSVVASAAIFFGWSASMALSLFAQPILTGSAGLLSALLGSGILIVSFCGGLFLSGLTTRPLRGVFKHHTFHGQEALVNRFCTVLTHKVSEKFGQASFDTGGAPLVLPVRCPVENALAKGSLAMITGYDRATQTYEVAEVSPEKAKLLKEIEASAELADAPTMQAELEKN